MREASCEEGNAPPFSQLASRFSIPSAYEQLTHSSSLVREEPAFPLQSTTEPRQVTAGAYHTVAGHDDRYWISSVCRSDRAHGFRSAEPPGQLAIADRLAVGNGTERFPASGLEWSALRAER